jgi:hypothetical protein
MSVENNYLDSIYHVNIDTFQNLPESWRDLNGSQKKFIKDLFSKLSFDITDYQKQKTLVSRFVEKTIFHINKNLYFTFYQNKAFKITTEIIQKYAKKTFEKLVSTDKLQAPSFAVNDPEIQEFFKYLYDQVNQKAQSLKHIVLDDTIQQIKKNKAFEYYKTHIKKEDSQLLLEDFVINKDLENFSTNQFLVYIIAIIKYDKLLITIQAELKQLFVTESEFKPILQQLTGTIKDAIRQNKDFSLVDLNKQKEELINKTVKQANEKKVKKEIDDLNDAKTDLELKLKEVKQGKKDLKSEFHLGEEDEKFLSTHLSRFQALKAQLEQFHTFSNRLIYNQTTSKKLVSCLKFTPITFNKTTFDGVQKAFDDVKSLVEELSKKDKTPLKLTTLRKELGVYEKGYTKEIEEIKRKQKELIQREYEAPKQALESQEKKLEEEINQLGQQVVDKIKELNQLVESREKGCFESIEEISLIDKEEKIGFEQALEAKIQLAAPLFAISHFLRLKEKLPEQALNDFIKQQLSSTHLYNKKAMLNCFIKQNETYKNIYLPILKVLAHLGSTNSKESNEVFEDWVSQLNQLRNSLNISELNLSLSKLKPQKIYRQLESFRLSLLAVALSQIKGVDLIKELPTLDIPSSFEPDFNEIEQNGKEAIAKYLQDPTKLPNFSPFFKSNPIIGSWSPGLQFILLNLLILNVESNKKLEKTRHYRKAKLYEIKDDIKKLDQWLIKRLEQLIASPYKNLFLKPLKEFIIPKLVKSIIETDQSENKEKFKSQKKKISNLGKDLFDRLIQKNKLDFRQFFLLIEPHRKVLRATLDYIEELEKKVADPLKQAEKKQALENQQTIMALDYFKVAKGIAPIFEINQNYQQFAQLIDSFMQNVRDNPPVALNKAPFLPWLEQTVLISVNHIHDPI